MKSSIENEITTLINHSVKCVDCGGALEKNSNHLTCSACKRDYKRDANGVWNFSLKNRQTFPLSIYKEKQFLEWQKVFEEQEVHNWSIYKSKFRRFFSQAGHRCLANLLNLNTRSEYLLEIGAGNGALLDHFKTRHYIGIDTSKNSLAVLKKKFPFAIAILTEDTFLPFGKGVFSNVISLHTLEHIYPLGEHLEEVRKVLKDGGRYSFVIPTEGGFSFWLGRQLFTKPHVKRNYGLDVNYIMDREHINDANRVLKFLKMYFNITSYSFWPLKIPTLSFNAMIHGYVEKEALPTSN